ncbi:DUF3857 domain-containing protein, partial [Bacteroidota bacterium]
MLKIKKIIGLVSVIILLSCISSSASGNEKTDAVYLNIEHEYILNSNGSITYNYSHRVKLFTSYAVNRRFGESFIVYNPDFQKLVINKSNTTMADGSVVESPFNAFNEVLPRFANHSAAYLNLREMVVTHIGLEKNAVIDFDYTITTQNGMFPSLIGKQIIGDRVPIERMTIIVKVPKGKVLNYYLSKNEIKSVKSEDDKFDIYTWGFENIPLVEVESHQPGFEEICPVLYFSSASPNEVIDHMIANEKSLYHLSPQAHSIVKELVNGKQNNIEKAFAVQNYLQKYVGTMSGELVYTGFKPMNADEVFKRNDGSQLDKAVLLTAMLRAAEMDAVPVMVSQSSDMNGNISLVGGFENALVMCKGILPNGENLFLDPVDKQDGLIPNRIIGKTFFTVTPNPKCMDYSSDLLAQNFLEMEGEFKIGEEGIITGLSELEIDGYFNKKYNTDDIADDLKSGFKSQGYLLKVDSRAEYGMEKNSFTTKVNMSKILNKNEITGYYELELP